jgi:quercetin dioxygenase-like cupin family protein
VIELLLAVVLTADQIALDNEYVRVTRDVAPCASASVPGCGERVVVALGEIELESGGTRRHMTRGDIAVFSMGESYEPPLTGPFFEIAIKPRHPPVQSPSEIIPAEKNLMRYEGEHFFVFEEMLAPGETRARHSHSQRVVMQLNRARLQQWRDGEPPIFVETVPDRATFNPPVIHVVKNVGDTPLRGIVIEFKPEPNSAMSR